MNGKHLLIIITLLSVPLCKDIHIITTNDVHGVIAPQKAYFMNPNFPPDILGWAAFYKYVEKLRNETSVMLVAGDWYGMDHYLRFGYGAKSSDLREALDRISPVLKSL